MTEWVFVGPNAVLNDRSGKQVGKYYGPPATWEGMDGSKLTATQLAVAPSSPGSLPLQLVKANPAIGQRCHDRRDLHPARGHSRAAWHPPRFAAPPTRAPGRS
jgi:hypothetical protein